MKNAGVLFRRGGRPGEACHRRWGRWAAILLSFGVIGGAVLTGTVFSAPADAATSFTFTGRGNGHGMGLSQWGAWEGAREGNTYQQILAFYYPGTTLSHTADLGDADPIIQVRVSSKPWTSGTTIYSAVTLSPTVSPATLYMDRTSQGDIAVGTIVKFENIGGNVRVTVAGDNKGSCAMAELQPTGSDTLEGRVQVTLTTVSGEKIDPREYWGIVRVQRGESAGELWVYNRVSLEKYVRGVAEVDYDWAIPGGSFYAPDAVKAQAVASRTYAVAKNGATLSDSWADQCYRGYSFEADHPGVAQAAEDTAGEILTYAGQPIAAYFSGHSGGYTSDSAWSGAKPPYIVAQPDPWSLNAPPSGTGEGPGWTWSYTISASSLSSKVNGSLKDTSGRTVRVGQISAVEIVSRDTADAGSHAKTLRLTGTEGSADVSVLSFRALLGTSNLPSTLIVAVNGDPGVGDSGAGDSSDSGGSGSATGGGSVLLPGEFSDIGPNHLYHDEISRVVVSQLMDGYEDGTFRPEGPVSRAQFAKIAVSLYNLLHVGGQIPVVNVLTKPFDDVPVDSKTTGDASDWIAAAKSAGLVAGVTASLFAPYDDIQRDQMATMMCRALGWQDEAAALPLDTPGFADVPTSSPHWAAVTYLKVKGVLLGYEVAEGDEPLLGAAEPIKREHVAVILCRVLDLAE
jgi:stage II sporulation protein D